MKLYAFGYSAAYQPASLTSPNTSSGSLAPTCILHAKTIRILWISWCDCVIAYSDNDDIKAAWVVQYRGSGLTSAQAEHVAKSEIISQTAGADGSDIDFFGSEMHHGLRGYVIHRQDGSGNTVVIFSSPAESETGAAAVQSYQITGNCTILSIRVDSEGGYLVNTADRAARNHRIIYFESFEYLQKQLCTGCIVPVTTLMTAASSPKQWVTNSTVATVLGFNGDTYTSSRDSRYPKCLGRAYTVSANFNPVEYLSETRVVKIASGGYMSAAVSFEGELFIWGQGNPGSQELLCVLNDKGNMGTAPAETGIGADDDQDDMVKCLNLMIKREEACVYDVVIGHGHVLVATQVQRAGGVTERTVQCAGSNSKGQLGIPTKRSYVENFEMVPVFQDLEIQSMAAAGWSTLVVTSEE